MTRVLTVLLLVSLQPLLGCASSPPPEPRAIRPIPTGPSVAIVASGDSRFAVAEPRAQPGRTLDEVMKWHPYGAAFRPLADIVHRAVNRFLDAGRAEAIDPALPVPPSSAVGDAMARALRASGQFDQVRTFDREPIGDDRRQADAIVRVTVPSWGLVRVRSGEPDLVSTFADTRVQVVARETGTVLWESDEDVTGAGRMPLASFSRDREFAREELMGVLERAGHRLASEFLYVRSASR